MAQDDDMGDLSAALARAEAAVKALAKDYLVWAKADLDLCRQHLAAARAEPARRQEHIAALYGVAHNIKGQGSSFGYPLMTRLGDSLCLVTRQPRAAIEAMDNLVTAHLQVMDQVLTSEAGGEGSPALRASVAALEATTVALDHS